MKMEDVKEMIDINKEQAEYYDSISIEDDKEEQTGYAKHKKANILTRIWANLRYKQQRAFESSGLEDSKSSFHQKWIKTKAGGDSLEIGCFRGTNYSMPLIDASGRYLGIDLSANAIAVLNKNLEKKGVSHKAKGKAMDFLLMEEDEKYDLIFAHGVLHHFEYPEPLFSKISKLLKPDGILLLTEPSQVNTFYSFLRSIYRPFQSDSAWEWPFTKNTVSTMENYFKPVDGFGWGRWSLLISVFQGLPLIEYIVNPLYRYILKKEISSGWHKNVWSNSTITAACRKK